MKALLKTLLILAALVGVCKDSRAESLTLEEYIAARSELEVSGLVIACAAGGEAVSMGEKEFPVSIYFYPIPGAANFRYFESDSPDIDPEDRSRYREKSLEIAPVFNGYLRRFQRGPVTSELWGIVAYEAGGRLLLSNPIRLKLANKPTQMANELVTIEPGATEPKFRWRDGAVRENAIYFQVVSDAEGNLISGTYTRDQHWRFYHLDNVVFNIRAVQPLPTLKPDTRYTFTLMGVSEDNWVNLMARKSFTTGQ